MQFRQKLAYIALGCMILLSGVVLLISVRAQAPKQAQITFQSNRDGNYEIYIMDADGKNVRRLTNHPAEDWLFLRAWSPDAQRIAFNSDRDGNQEIYVMNADGNNPRRLTNNPAMEGAASWSPDGQKIRFVSNRDGNFEIYIMDADGQNPNNLTNHPANDRFPDWFDPASARIITHAGKLKVIWGRIKQTSK